MTQPRMYGGWRRSRGIGLFGLGTTATFTVLGVFIVLLITAALTPALLVYVAPPAVVGCAIGMVRSGGVPLLQIAVHRVRWWHAARGGWTRYRAAALLESAGAARLPGTLAPLELISAEDGYGGRYGLIRDQRTGFLTATLRLIPASTWLAEQDDADGWVAAWGGWLASLGHVPLIRWVTVTVETAPEPGSALSDAVAASTDPAAPEPARAIMAALATTAPASSSHVDTRISLTFDPGTAPGRTRTVVDAVAETGRVLHGLQARLGSCGVAVTGRIPAAGIAAIVRAACDPAGRGEVGRVLSSGTAHDGRLAWDSAGPQAADELWDRYRHDSGVSVSWAWREAPRCNVQADVLARLTSPGPWAKRVSLQFRPLPAAAATRVLENEVRAAEFRQEYARRTHRDATARDAFDHARARQAAMEEAQGAGVTLVSLYVTVTTTGEEELGDAVAATEAAAESSRIQLRRLYGSQSAAFTVGLPCGICLPALAGRSRRLGGGIAMNTSIVPATEYQGTTTQVCGLYPFTAGSGAPRTGTPVGRHMLSGEAVCMDPLCWLRAGLTTNPGVFIIGDPGIGKSVFGKRLTTGGVAAGTRVLILGDTKPDYTSLTLFLGGQVIRIGRGLHTINPLDSGPLGAALRQVSGPQAATLRREVRARRLALLMALCTLVRGARLGNAEEVLLGRAIDLLDERLSGAGEPSVPDVLAVIADGPDVLRTAARSDSTASYQARASELAFTLELLCTGSLAGVFDGQTSLPIDLDAPVVSVDISAVKAAGDQLLTAAMLCTWSYAFGVVDAAAALADLGLAPRRSYMGVMDELWRALRGAPGLVEYADSLTRLNRAKGMSSVMITHSLSDLDALATEEDRAKARGFIDRCAIKVLAGLPPRELTRLAEIVPMTGPEQKLVASWSAPENWQPGTRHPGRGRYLIKVGGRLGIPVELALTEVEQDLYDTEQAIRAGSRR